VTIQIYTNIHSTRLCLIQLHL